MKSKPKVAILRGPLLNPFEMQSYELLKGEFELVAFAPHITQFDLSPVSLSKETLWCPIAGKAPFERTRRKWQALRDAVTKQTHSFCGMMDRLKGFDIIHIKDQPFCFSYEAVLAKRKYGGRLVVTQMENIPFLNDHKFMERHIKKSVRDQADLFLAASDGARKTLLEEGVSEKKIRRISNSVDVHSFSPGKADKKLKKSLGLPQGAFVVLYVGRLAASKGIFTLLAAAQELAVRDSGFHFLLVGKDEEGISEWISRNSLESRVRLAGFVPYDIMPDYYRLSDVFVIPSLPTRGWLEQFGYVLAEAMACGVPVMGSDCGAIPEVIGDPANVFPAGSVEGLVRVLLALRKRINPDYKRRLRKRACALYSSEVLARNIADAYREVLAAT